jgi:hypothetical protein
MAEGGVTPSYKCAACKKDIPNHPTTIERHNGGKSHKRIIELLGKQGILAQWKIEWDVGSKSVKCLTCDSLVQCSFQKIKAHRQRYHDLPSSNEPKKEVFKVFRARGYFKSQGYDFEVDMKNFETISGGKRLEHMGGCVGILRPRVISEPLADRFYHWASWLEANGNAKDRSEDIGGSCMVAYGMTNRGYANW